MPLLELTSTLSDKCSPLLMLDAPDWAQYFLELGSAFASQPVAEGMRICCLLTVPIDDFCGMLVAAGCIIATEMAKPAPRVDVRAGDTVLFRGRRWHCVAIDVNGRAILDATTAADRKRLGRTSVHISQLQLANRRTALGAMIGDDRARRINQPACDVVVVGGLGKVKEHARLELPVSTRSDIAQISISELCGNRVCMLTSRRGLVDAHLCSDPHLATFADANAYWATQEAGSFSECHQLFILSRSITGNRSATEDAREVIRAFRQAKGASPDYLQLPSACAGVEWEAFLF